MNRKEQGLEESGLKILLAMLLTNMLKPQRQRILHMSITEKARPDHYEPFHLQILHHCRQIYKLLLKPDLGEWFFQASPDSHLPHHQVAHWKKDIFITRKIKYEHQQVQMLNKSKNRTLKNWNQ